MKITYRTKDVLSSMGIQVDYKPEENIQPLIDEMVEIGFKHSVDNVPIAFKRSGLKTSYFHRNGSSDFGLKTEDEVYKFMEDSKPILEKFDKKLDSTNCYFYNND